MFEDVVVGEKVQKLKCGYGIWIEIPDRVLPPDVTASLCVKTIMALDYGRPA